MESSSALGACLSPESTVTSLLSSSGHLGSSLVAPEHTTTFRYKHKLYDSASAALNAYIADFSNSQPRGKTLTGNLNVSHRFPSAPSAPRATALRNRDVLREHLTDRELDFLSLPDCSPNPSVHPDRVSMTTDELLSIPYDGSMPVTHTSAFIQGLSSQGGAPQPGLPSRSLSMCAVPEGNRQGAPPPGSFRRRGAAASRLRAEPLRLDRREPSSSLHLPHWLTSYRWDADGSEVSVPQLKYPPWIHCCDVSEPPAATGTPLWDRPASGPGTPSWVEELDEEADPQHTNSQADSQLTLRDLRLQLAQQISLLAAERTDSSAKEKLFRDDRIESLLGKADRVLNSLARGRGAAEADPAERSSPPVTPEPVTPPDTEELLCRPSSGHPPDSLASPAGGATAHPTDRGPQVAAAAALLRPGADSDLHLRSYLPLCAVLGPGARRSPWERPVEAAWPGRGPQAGALQAAGCGGGAPAAAAAAAAAARGLRASGGGDPRAAGRPGPAGTLARRPVPAEGSASSDQPEGPGGRTQQDGAGGGGEG